MQPVMAGHSILMGCVVHSELINGVEDKTRKLPPFPSSWTKRVTMMLDIVKGLQFLHSFDIIHRYETANLASSDRD
jgi:hypothetical protein